LLIIHKKKRFKVAEFFIQGESGAVSSTAFGVSWDCSSEFEATSSQDISFLETDSYLTIGSGLAKTGSTVRFGLKTLSREAVLLYSSGPPAKPDFAAVELVEGQDSSQSGGGGAVDLFSDQAVHDGLWHSVSPILTNRNSQST